MVRIDLTAMKAGPHEVSVQPEAEALGLDPEDFKSISAQAHLDISDRQILVDLGVDAIANLKCDRTLVQFDQAIDGTYTVVFTKDEIAAEEAPANVRPLESNSTELDLTDIIRDTLILAVPLRKVAPEAVDKDLVLHYGQPDPNTQEIDPRWKALEGLGSDS